MAAQEQASKGGLLPALLRETWFHPVVTTERTLHQLSPYIGKLKSSIAADIIRAFSKPGDVILDPFCGAGTIPLEAMNAGRRGFWSDVSPYAYTLTKAKLSAPESLAAALKKAELALAAAAARKPPDLRRVPLWVRSYFHPQTLREVLSFVEICRENEEWFLLACLLGILHHQRPGFLSYPSSHLVPYLRSAKFPADAFPELYEYRPLLPRLLKKVTRAYKRPSTSSDGNSHEVLNASLQAICMPQKIDALITSPPYMNALDYGRDNRLRLWFLDPEAAEQVDSTTPGTMSEFRLLMDTLAAKAAQSLKLDGYCVLIVGDLSKSPAGGKTAAAVISAFQTPASPFVLEMNELDSIPDVRRARRYCRAVKAENIIVFRKSTNRVTNWISHVDA